MDRTERIKKIEGIIFKRVQYQYLPKEDCYMVGSPKELATAIDDAIEFNEKKLEYLIYNENPKVFCPEKGGYIYFHILGKGLEGVVKTISTNKEIININV